MILRILGSGQFEVGDDVVEELNKLDDALMAAVDAKDETALRSSLEAIHNKVKSSGKAVDDDYLGPSGLILPDAEATLDEVASLMQEDGIIPG